MASKPATIATEVPNMRSPISNVGSHEIAALHADTAAATCAVFISSPK